MYFAIAIAVQEAAADGQGVDGSGWGDVIAGLVYQPITDESFWAEKSRGAWLQDRRLRVSARRHLDEALIGTGIPFANRGDAPEWIRTHPRGPCVGSRKVASPCHPFFPAWGDSGPQEQDG